jgi:hypothetical protein
MQLDLTNGSICHRYFQIYTELVITNKVEHLFVDVFNYKFFLISSEATVILVVVHCNHVFMSVNIHKPHIA